MEQDRATVMGSVLPEADVQPLPRAQTGPVKGPHPAPPRGGPQLPKAPVVNHIGGASLEDPPCHPKEMTGETESEEAARVAPDRGTQADPLL